MQPSLTSAQRRRLRGDAQLLEAALKLGQQGITPAFLAALDDELTRRELVKVRFSGHKDERHELSEALAEQSGSALVQVVGHVAVFYRPRPKEMKEGKEA